MNLPLCTPVRFQPVQPPLTEHALTASVGSCFSEKIVRFLQVAGMTCASNPNGIVYNPVSMAESLRHAVHPEPYPEDTFFEQDGLWHSFAHHGSFSAQEKDALLQKTEESSRAFGEFLRRADLVILTPGTAVVFRRRANGRVAANCHRVPGTEFIRELLSFESCVSALEESLALLQSVCKPSCRFVLSVSPVRHHPGDPVLNTRSKALLIAACHAAAEKFADRTVYFPAFEILNEELRDYRFYAEDMLHPSATAEKIIIERFLQGFFGENSAKIFERGLANAAAAVHIPREAQKA